MTEQEILELIRQHLPRLMQENPQVREWIRELVAQYGITREEWVAFLERFDRLIEAVDRNTEQISRLWEAVSRLWEAVRENTEQISRLWQSLDALREEISLMRQTYDSAIARLEQSVARLDQTVARLDAEVQLLKQAMETGFERVHRRITALGARWGLENEKAFRAGLKGILEQRFGVTVTQWRHYDEQGFVFGTPTWVEADVLIHNGEHLLVEVKAHVSRGDISEFRRLGQFYEQVTGIKPRLIIVSPFVDQRAADLAQLWDIAIYEEPEDVPTESQGENEQ
ncbi:MAG: PD-(D/E)XK nuclease family protein [Armatimonadota bacterium]